MGKKISYLFILLCITCQLAFAQGKKPNVVLILTDDQGWGDLSLHGNPVLETKNLDKLAHQGAQFNNFYVSPLCAPTRASILTGRYHLETGVVSVSNGLEIMDTNETTLAELFKANGYHTGIFGKWHNGQHFPNRPIDQGFDEFLGFTAGHWSNYFDTDLTQNDKTVKTKGFITDVLTDEAIKFIGKNKEEPFFCYLPYNAPHSPFQVPDKYFNKYKSKGLDDELAAVYGMVENVDDNVGRLLNYLKANNLEENTIVIFMTDNGPNTVRYNGVMRGIKGSVHEGGVRVPFFIKWPGKIAENLVNIEVVGHIDIYPTLLELCGLNPLKTKPLDGESFADLLSDKSLKKPRLDRKMFTNVNFMQVPATLNTGGFRNNEYRYVYEKNQSQLYLLNKDLSENNDLLKKNPQLSAEFENDYKQWFANVSANLSYYSPIILSKIGVQLPAYEAVLTEGLKYKEGHGWAHDYVTKWSSTKDNMIWEIDCVNPGKYNLVIEYLCSKKNVGSTILVNVDKESKSVKVTKAFSSVVIPSPDRVPRKEAYEIKKWGKLKVGEFLIPKGKSTIMIKSTYVKGDNVMEFNQLNVCFSSEN
jgi:arylsulfatase A